MNETQPEKIHTTIGVYNSGDMKLNGVCEANLEGHIKYNLDLRPGRGFFVDGKCLNKGYLSEEQVSFYEKLFQSDSKYNLRKDSAPYI
jgi:hypothetical protein